MSGRLLKTCHATSLSIPYFVYFCIALIKMIIRYRPKYEFSVSLSKTFTGCFLHSETHLWGWFQSPHCENRRFSCMGFLRDVARSRQSKQAFFALNLSQRFFETLLGLGKASFLCARPFATFLWDVARSRQSKQAFYALNFRNVIEIKPLRGFFGAMRIVIGLKIRKGGLQQPSFLF